MIADAVQNTTGESWLNIPMAQLAAELVSLLPIVLPVVITLLALRKGIRFLMSTLRGA